MLGLVFLAFTPAQFPAIESTEFAREVQTAGLAATVRVQNPTKKMVGSGVVIASDKQHLYVLTAQHIVAGTDLLEIVIYSAESYPRAQQVLRLALVIAESRGVKDLALVKVRLDGEAPRAVALHPAPRDFKRERFHALTVGCSLGVAPTCQVDEVGGAKLVKRANRDDVGYCWEVDRKQATGRSGGPMLDRRGYLIGICSGNSGGKSYFCHIREIEAFLADTVLRDLVSERK